jgi:hypothetical protein
MSIDNIVRMLDEELTTLRKVRALLAATGKLPASITHSLTSKQRVRKRSLSPEARRAIAEAQRKRWAKLKSRS